MAEQQAEDSMRQSGGEPDVQLYISNMCAPRGFIAKAGPGAYQRLLDEINQGSEDGLRPAMRYEITPTRALAVCYLLSSRRATHEGRHPEPITDRVHQTWPKGLLRGLWVAPSLQSAVTNTLAVAAMPETRRSRRTLARMGDVKGGTTYVAYADEVDKQGKLTAFHGLGRLVVAQIMPETLMATGAFDPYNYRRFHDSLWNRGLTGVIGANHHLARAAIADPAIRLDYERVLDDVEYTSTNMMGAHAEAGRVDSEHKADRDRSQQELAAIFEGPDAIAETDMGQIWKRCYGIWRGQRAHRWLPQSRLQESQDVTASHLESHRDSDGSLKWWEYFQAVAQDPIEAQCREENIYRGWLNEWQDVFPVTQEIPYGGLRVHYGKKRLRRPDFVSMHRDAAESVAAYFARLRQEYDLSA
jgi:hypothetical protein